jgi:hypothetical protein
MKHNSSRAGSKNLEADFHELEKLAAEEPTADRAASRLAKLLKVQRTEVALLRVEQGLLKFLCPSELRTAGAIPVSSNAVAARTVTTRTSLLSNTFTRIKHVSLFESVRLGTGSEANETIDPTPIQKLMSVPIQSEEGIVVGVVQISRKGQDVNASGPDFTNEELRLLERAASVIARMGFMRSETGNATSAGR